KLLESAGFKVANSSLWNLAGESVLVVERFDRAIEEGGVKRTHIIDACQMLDMPASYKYEQNFGNGRDVKNIREGVSFKKLFSLADRCRVPVVAKKELIAWVCGNLILGNSDAHGKNISFLVNRDGIEIAPVYDVTNISLLGERYDSSIAMSINEEHNIEALTNYDFEEFCSENNINMDFFTTTFEKISKNIIKGFDSKALISEIEKFGGTNFLAHYKEDVLRRSDKLLSVLNFFDCDEGELPDRDDIKAMSKTEREDAVRALADGDSGLKLK
ncbi:MAG: hypothetical protein QG567_1714, partial [Campylobacterota bacterium]|nr:hypothetical protein [Campylobacterota bacterium]